MSSLIGQNSAKASCNDWLDKKFLFTLLDVDTYTHCKRIIIIIVLQYVHVYPHQSM